MQRSIVALFVAGALSLGLAGPAAAQVEQDGLVNVFVGESLIDNVSITDAVDIVVQACGVDVGAFVSVLARVAVVDRTGRERTFCTTEEGDITVTQN